MIRKLNSIEEFGKYIGRIQESYVPNSEFSSPRMEEGREYHNQERVDLSSIPDKTLVLVKSLQFGADYRIRVDDTEGGRKVNIWRNMECNGLTAPLESVASLIGEFTFEEGVIKLNKHLIVPYFRYKGNSVERPRDMGMQPPVSIIVQQFK